MLVTVFTPVYNRAHCITRLYESLKSQTNRQFEWLIIDDGSTDNIKHVVSQFISENIINIRFLQQQNRGKHTAINAATNVAQGDLFYIVDSDDAITSDAIEFIITEGAKILDNENFIGIAGCDETFDGHKLSEFSYKSVDATPIDIRINHGIKGDLAEVFKTDLLRKFPFPEIDDERFCPEALVWNRIGANGYQLRYFPKTIKLIEYLPDGLSASIVRVRAKSPVASTICYSELSDMEIPFIHKLKAAINFWRFWFCSSPNKKARIKLRWWWLSPIGLLMNINDKRKL